MMPAAQMVTRPEMIRTSQSVMTQAESAIEGLLTTALTSKGRRSEVVLTTSRSQTSKLGSIIAEK